MRLTHQLGQSLQNEPDRRNFRSSPIYRALHERFADYALLVRFCRKQDHGAVDGFARRAGARLRMGDELRRLDTLAFRASFPKILALLLLVVLPTGCTILGGCTPGETRCKGNVVEECYSLKGWERTEVCGANQTCHYDDPKACSTYDVACCAPVQR